MSNSNVQKMREALKAMNDLFEKGVICTSYANTAEEMEQIEELYRKAKDALPEPPRNCDIGTAEEQTKRYDVYCYDHMNMENCCGDCPLKQAAVCEIAFGQLPYEEGGAK